MSDKNDLMFIEHILDSIYAIEEFSKNIDLEELISNRMKQSAIIREMEIIGEAVKNVSDDLKNKYSLVFWKKIAGTRDKMIHNYFGINFDIVLNILKNDVPVLKNQIEEIKRGLKCGNV